MHTAQTSPATDGLPASHRNILQCLENAMILLDQGGHYAASAIVSSTLDQIEAELRAHAAKLGAYGQGTGKS